MARPVNAPLTSGLLISQQLHRRTGHDRALSLRDCDPDVRLDFDVRHPESYPLC